MFCSWAPGRIVKLQCDFSATIGPRMFGELMVPVLSEMCSRVSYSRYRRDGPGAIPHHDHLLSIPDLDMLQWTPGVGQPPPEHRRWWPLYHTTVDAGKKIYIGGLTPEGLLRLRREFGRRLDSALIGVHVPTRADAEVALGSVEWRTRRAERRYLPRHPELPPDAVRRRLHRDRFTRPVQLYACDTAVEKYSCSLSRGPTPRMLRVQ